MMSLKPNVDGVTGSIQIGGIDRLTFNADGGVKSKQPMFSAVPAVVTSLTSGTWVKVTYGTSQYDTNSNYSTATSRFTPTVAGYYRFTVTVSVASTPSTVYVAVAKNGSLQKLGGTSQAAVVGAVSCTIYMNGTTDYAEAYCNQSAGAQNNSLDPLYNYFQAELVRAA